MDKDDDRVKLLNLLYSRDSMDYFSTEDMSYLRFLIEQDIQYSPDRRII